MLNSLRRNDCMSHRCELVVHVVDLPQRDSSSCEGVEAQLVGKSLHFQDGASRVHLHHSVHRLHVPHPNKPILGGRHQQGGVPG